MHSTALGHLVKCKWILGWILKILLSRTIRKEGCSLTWHRNCSRDIIKANLFIKHVLNIYDRPGTIRKYRDDRMPKELSLTGSMAKSNSVAVLCQDRQLEEGHLPTVSKREKENTEYHCPYVQPCWKAGVQSPPQSPFPLKAADKLKTCFPLEK